MPNLAKANLLSRKTRSVITILGIAFSVALILIVAGMVNGTISDIADRILNIGADIMVGSREVGIFYPSDVISGKYKAVIEEIEGVAVATPVLIESASNVNDQKFFNYIYGIDYEEYNALGVGFKFVEGTKLENEYDMIIDIEVAHDNGFHVGDRINMLNQDWKVSGVVRKALGARFYVDRRDLAEIVQPGRDPNLARLFYVKVEEGANVEEISESLRQNLGKEDWSIQNVKDVFESIFGKTVGIKEFVISVIGVSAIMCFAIIMLSMYNAIIERTRDIGILKSLGATKGFIVFEIVKEALVIVTLGIIAGFILSWISIQIILSLFPILQIEITWQWVVNSAIIATLATLLGTVYPAFRASRMDPVEALMWE